MLFVLFELTLWVFLFTQGDSFSSRRHGGAGVGPALRKRLVETMRGRIRPADSSESGSIFRFTMVLDHPVGGGARPEYPFVEPAPWSEPPATPETLKTSAADEAAVAPVDLRLEDLLVRGPAAGRRR